MLRYVLPFVLLALCIAGCADSGSRSQSVTTDTARESIGPWLIEWWPGAKLQEIEWLRETTREHDALIATLDPLLQGYRGRIVFYETQPDVQQAFFVVRQQYGVAATVPLINPLALTIGFWHPWDGSFHLWPGYKLEGDGLTQGMLRHIYQDFNVALPLPHYWQRVMNEDFLLALAIFNRR